MAAVSHQTRISFLPLSVTVWLAAALALTVLLVPGGSALAQQSATCRVLAAQLASVETGRGATNSARYRKYDRAVRQQQVQIRKTERAARRNGCQLLRTNICRRINSSLQKMYANLSQLKTARNASGGGGGASRADILRAMKNNNCYARTNTASVERTPNRRRTLLEQIFGTKTYRENGTGYNELELGRNFGTWRTLCVRTCDGYYFPISFSTTQQHFEADNQQCQQMCPGAETRLFIHPMPSGDAEQSMSYRTGEAYADLPNAFAYRKGIDNACSCRFASANRGYEEIAGTTSEEQPADKGPNIPVPIPRQDRAMDPDSYINAEGGLTLERLAKLTNREDESPTANREIRIVGPAFFPVQ